MPIFNKLELPDDVEAKAREVEEMKKQQKAANKAGKVSYYFCSNLRREMWRKRHAEM